MNGEFTGPVGLAPIQAWAALPVTPFRVNFSSDLRLTTEAGISVHARNAVYAAESRLRRGERAWRMEVPPAVPPWP